MHISSMNIGLISIFILAVLAIFLLMIQGLWTRKTTLKLPEPKGPREGICSEDLSDKGVSGEDISGEGISAKEETLTLLIIGDSSAAGVGVDHQEHALSGYLTASLAKRFNVKWQLIAKTGYTSANIIQELQKHQIPFDHIDYALIAIGVNDVTSFTGSKRWQKNTTALIELLERQFQTKNIIFSAIPPMHLFTALPQPLRWLLGARAKYLNQRMATIIRSKPACHILHPELPFSEQYLADDKFHPSQAAYKLWAEQAAQLMNK
jgi:lysophospholipase L1-like esterase